MWKTQVVRAFGRKRDRLQFLVVGDMETLAEELSQNLQGNSYGVDICYRVDICY